MFNLIKKILNGTTNTTSTESSPEETERKMIKIKTNVPELDSENESLFKASMLLEKIGNTPNPTADEFYLQLMTSDLPEEDHQSVTLAAISIETMMSLDLQQEQDGWFEPTVH
jgi:hypothetical protein